MKIPHNKFLSKKILLVSVIFLLVVMAVLAYVYALNGNLFGWKIAQNTPTTINYGPPTPNQLQNGTTIKSNNASPNSTSGSDQPSAPTPISESSQKSVSVSITAANQNGPTLQIRVLIGVVENKGACTLTLEQTGQKTVTKTAGTQALASSSTCQGFDIPITELSTGVWHIAVTYNSPLLTGATTKDITIK